MQSFVGNKIDLRKKKEALHCPFTSPIIFLAVGFISVDASARSL